MVNIFIPVKSGFPPSPCDFKKKIFIGLAPDAEPWLIPCYTNPVLSLCSQLLTMMSVKCWWSCPCSQPQIRSAGHLKMLTGSSWVGEACSRIMLAQRNLEHAGSPNSPVVGGKNVFPEEVWHRLSRTIPSGKRTSPLGARVPTLRWRK